MCVFKDFFHPTFTSREQFYREIMFITYCNLSVSILLFADIHVHDFIINAFSGIFKFAIAQILPCMHTNGNAFDDIKVNEFDWLWKMQK